MEKLNIAVIGWFNYLNAGDDRIGEVLIKTLHPHNVKLLSSYNKLLLNEFDLLVFTAGFWYPKHEISGNFKKWYKNVNIPYMAIGLGVEKSTSKKCKESWCNAR